MEETDLEGDIMERKYFHLDKDLNIAALKKSKVMTTKDKEIKSKDYRRIWINNQYVGLIKRESTQQVAKTFRNHGHKVRIRKIKK